MVSISMRQTSNCFLGSRKEAWVDIASDKAKQSGDALEVVHMHFEDWAEVLEQYLLRSLVRAWGRL